MTLSLFLENKNLGLMEKNNDRNILSSDVAARLPAPDKSDKSMNKSTSIASLLDDNQVIRPKEPIAAKTIVRKPKAVKVVNLLNKNTTDNKKLIQASEKKNTEAERPPNTQFPIFNKPSDTTVPPPLPPLSPIELLAVRISPGLTIYNILNAKYPPKINRNKEPKIRRPQIPQVLTIFQSEIPQAKLQYGENNERWYLRCFCDNPNELGFMIQCEKCENWQHAACVNINMNTLPANYQCPICSGKHIRCSCENNLDYKHALIKCTKCQYYVHRRCEDIDNGVYYTANHVCKQCGGTPNPNPDVFLPFNNPFENSYINITKDVIEKLHPSVLSSPFASIFTEEYFNQDLSAFQFCEAVYNRLKPFFNLTHPFVTFATQKKRRGEVSFSFFKAIFYILDFLFAMTQEMAIAIFDTLVKEDIYRQFTPPDRLYPSQTNPIEFSDKSKAEFDKVKHINEVTQVNMPNDLQLVDGGVVAQSALQPDQLVGIISGFVGLLDEFDYDNGADFRYYVVNGTKFVIDTRKTGNQLVHNIRRSLAPNCVIKFFRYGGFTYSGVFAGVSEVNGISHRTRREKFIIPANTELLLPIDFAPVVIEEPTDYMYWHFEDIESPVQEPLSSPPPPKVPRPMSPPKRPSREERDEASFYRQVKKLKKKRKDFKEKDDDKKGKKKAVKLPVRPPKQHAETIEYSLFDLIRSPNPEPYIFDLPQSEPENDEINSQIQLRDLQHYNEEIDYGFLDHLLSTPSTIFQSLNISDPVEEMNSLIDLDSLDDFDD